MSKKNKNSKIIAGIISSAVLISGATTGILYNSEMEENIEEEIEIEKKKNLEIIFPKGKRNLGKIYIGQNITAINDDEKVKKEIIDIFSNKYNIDVTSLEIKIVTNQNQAIITSINEDIYIGTVKLKYSPNRSFVTLDYIVPDLNIRDKQVPTYSYQHHQEILFGKNDILNDNEFKNLPAVNDFINILNEQVKFKASEESNNAFKKLENNNDNFKDFEDLKKQFNDHHLLFDGKIDFESFIKTISNYHINANIDELKTAICRFYNILAQLYGKNNVFKMLEKIELVKSYENNLKINMSGEAYFGSCNDNMCNTKIILDTDIFRDIKYGMEVMVHEYGHILDSLIRNKQNNNFDARKYMISSLANGTKINNKSYQKLLSYGIVRSWYGRTSYIDLFPEAFGRWIMTPEQNRDLGWEKLDKFFRIDLLKLL